MKPSTFWMLALAPALFIADLPADKPLTLVAYEADTPPCAYVEPTAVGSVLPSMPLFLQPGWYINVPLEQTYMAAYRGVPEVWREVIEGQGN